MPDDILITVNIQWDAEKQSYWAKIAYTFPFGESRYGSYIKFDHRPTDEEIAEAFYELGFSVAESLSILRKNEEE